MEKRNILESGSDREANMVKLRIEAYNDSEGKLTGYDCSKCKNKGYIAKEVDGEEVVFECSCMPIRNSMSMINRSGLKRMIEQNTFQNYKAESLWQRSIKESAMEYVDHPDGWFYIGGSVGSGKTHICTAICGELLKRNVPVKYMLWRDEIVNLKSSVNEPEYEVMINRYKKVRCLYIDDFLKAGRGKVTDADINVVFEILNYRYNDSKLITIISSEKSVDEIIDIDEAVGSRIYQKAKEHTFYLSGNKNWRMRQ